MSETKNIVVLGSSYGGLSVAHIILNSIIPSLPNPSSYKVTIISPSKQLYWNLAVPRAILDLPTGKGIPPPSQDQIFGDIEAGLKKKHGNGKSGSLRWEFIEAFARRVDPEAQTVQFERVDGKEDTIGYLPREKSVWETITYDQLVVATGTRPQRATPVSAVHKNLPPPPFKALGTTSQTKSSLKQWAKAIEGSNTILLGGAGPTGVETSGELAEAFPDKRIILVSSQSQVLPRVLEKVAKTAEKMLNKSGVEVRTGARVQDVKVDNQSVSVTLSTGEVISVDLYIPTHHAFDPSTEFLPSSIKDSAGFVVMSNNLNNPTYPNIWGVGDVMAFPNNKNSYIIHEQAIIMAGNLKSSMLRAVGQKGKAFQEYEHSEEAPALVPIGSKQGTGQMNGWQLWSFLVRLFKGKDFFIGKMQDLVNGNSSTSGAKLSVK